MEQTKVKVTCVSKKEQKHYYNPEHQIQTIVELEVPYDEQSIYWKMSGDTNLELKTVNQEAANMFKIGEEYDILISPSEKE